MTTNQQNFQSSGQKANLRRKMQSMLKQHAKLSASFCKTADPYERNYAAGNDFCGAKTPFCDSDEIIWR